MLIVINITLISYFRDNPKLGDGNFNEGQLIPYFVDFRDNPKLGDGNR